MESWNFMSGASEVGSLTAHSNDESQFVGSSSGVYFINTVRQAFLKSFASSHVSPGEEFPPAEDTIVGSEDSPGGKNHSDGSNTSGSTVEEAGIPCRWSYDPTVVRALGKPPPLEQAKELMMLYFRVWHPLFPFLHGPTFLQEMELLYSEDDNHHRPARSIHSDHKNACWATIFQCVFNLAGLLRPDIHLPPDSKIKSPTNIHSLLGMLVYRHDVPSLQALLAAQLYLLATMSLRTASTVGGCILRSILHAGLHRCPFRYKELSSHDRQLRKRIFWCAYAIDRYLSQALGLPLGIQDSDVDVCLPGASELHDPVVCSGITPKTVSHHSETSPSEISFERPREDVPVEARNENSPGLASYHQLDDAEDQRHEQQHNREAPLANYVVAGKLTGRALELFHKSIHVRIVRRSSVLFLISDVHRWWNGLPPSLQGTTIRHGKDASLSGDEESFDLGPFFTVLYQHLILLINRPSLSLDPSTPDFCSGLQTCIGAARGILSALKAQVDGGQALFWPGFLSAAWMSGLVIAFACQLKQYLLSKGCREINECLEILRIMSGQWETAKHCHMALSVLLLNIRRQSNDQNNYLTFDSLNSEHSSTRPGRSTTKHTNADECSKFGCQKRRKLNGSHETLNRMRDHNTGNNQPSEYLRDSSPILNETTPSTQETPGNIRTEANGVHSTPSCPLNQGTCNRKRPRNAPSQNFTTLSSQPGGGTMTMNMNMTGHPTSSSSSLNLSGLEDSQWPSGSASATNFDLNMTDLFQGADWESLFDVIGQGNLNL
ncbi:hypothetical protein VTN00DRAFT_7762 [Thermoascus crustaceus]|uniref:uncharacterized protein n=1 Tax=Thermoascus crustaceus TaxID=5088 RepID=UPI00374450C6